MEKLKNIIWSFENIKAKVELWIEMLTNSIKCLIEWIITSSNPTKAESFLKDAENKEATKNNIQPNNL
jgi:hypothetical protein